MYVLENILLYSRKKRVFNFFLLHSKLKEMVKDKDMTKMKMNRRKSISNSSCLPEVKIFAQKRKTFANDLEP